VRVGRAATAGRRTLAQRARRVASTLATRASLSAARISERVFSSLLRFRSRRLASIASRLAWMRPSMRSQSVPAIAAYCGCADRRSPPTSSRGARTSARRAERTSPTPSASGTLRAARDDMSRRASRDCRERLLLASASRRAAAVLPPPSSCHLARSVVECSARPGPRLSPARPATPRTLCVRQGPG
jgi:hypothetical protein